MGGDADTPRVGVTLAVHHDKTGGNGERLKGLNSEGYLPERKKTRDVRKTKGSGCRLYLGNGKIWISQDNDSGPGFSGEPPGGNIDPGDEPGTYDLSVLNN